MREFVGMAKTTRRSTEGKLQTNSFPELRDWLDRQVPSMRRLSGAKRAGERLQTGHVIEAVLAWFAVQDTAQRDQIIQRGREVARLLEESGGIEIEDLRGLWLKRQQADMEGRKLGGSKSHQRRAAASS